MEIDDFAENNQKLDNQLNLALSLTEEERANSAELSAGFDPLGRTWELIVKYSGSLETVRGMGIQADELLNGYAVLTVPEGLVDAVGALPQIAFVEKPKRLFFAINRARAAACVSSLQEEINAVGQPLTGRGVLMAVLDSGIDYFHPDFCNEDGTTRIVALWDQDLGRVFYSGEINEALLRGRRDEAYKLVPSADASGHGTAVAGIAAGNGREQGGRYRGIAYESPLLVVKLGNDVSGGFPRTTALMRAANFAVKEAVRLGLPLVVNLSFGNTYGSHDGTSLLETFLNEISGVGRTTIVAGSGNEGAAAGHTEGNFEGEGNHEQIVELSVAPYETGFSVQLWKSYEDRFDIFFQAPSGERFGPLPEALQALRYPYRGMEIFVYYGKPGPYSAAQEIYFDFIPNEGNYVESGIWTFRFMPRRIVRGRYDLWLPSSQALNPATRFLNPSPDTTLTIPSAAAKVITVGAYDSISNSYADFSGRGYTRLSARIKPDIVAPGVGLMAPAARGGYASFTGTSFAAPVAAGAAALLMQFGIVEGRDLYLYGEKAKACLRRGAKPLPGFLEYPNPQTGFGRLCLADSLEI